MKLIEFVFKSGEDYKVSLLDLSDISTIEQNNKDSCILIMKDGRKYTLPGTYRGLTNRFTYAFGRIIDPYQDTILRPSINFFHRPDQVDSDEVFFDTYQFNAFKIAMNFNSKILEN